MSTRHGFTAKVAWGVGVLQRQTPFAGRTARTALLLAALCGIDYFSGLVEKLIDVDTDSKLTLIGAERHSVRRAVVLLPGFLMSGRCAGLAFKPYLPARDVLISVDYGPNCVSPQAIYRGLQPLLESLQPEGIVLYGASMGGLVAAGILTYYGRSGMPFGAATLVLDTAPASAAQIKRPAWLLDIGCRYQGGIISSALLAAAVALGRRPRPDSDADVTLVRRARRAGMLAGSRAAAAQGCFLKNAQLSRYEKLHKYVSSATFLCGYSPDRDPLINISESIATWRAFFPTMRTVTLSSRPGRWHLPIIERPKETAMVLFSERDLSRETSRPSHVPNTDEPALGGCHE